MDPAEVWAGATYAACRITLALWLTQLLLDRFDHRRLTLTWQIALATLLSVGSWLAFAPHRHYLLWQAVWITSGLLAVGLLAVQLRRWVALGPAELHQELHHDAEQARRRGKRRRGQPRNSGLTAAASPAPAHAACAPDAVSTGSTGTNAAGTNAGAPGSAGAGSGGDTESGRVPAAQGRAGRLVLLGADAARGLASGGAVLTGLACLYPAWLHATGLWAATFAILGTLAAAGLSAVALLLALETTVGGIGKGLLSLPWRGLEQFTLACWSVVLLLCGVQIAWGKADTWQLQIGSILYCLGLMVVGYILWSIPRRLAQLAEQQRCEGLVSLALAAWLAVLSLGVMSLLPPGWPWRHG
jgi:hypothetical protein